MFELRHLQVFREVARLGSLSAAGESLSYSQPAVSQQMAALERRAGVPLLERTTRGVRLTARARRCSVAPRRSSPNRRLRSAS
jgi:DNA-binding transcriptional LysR family regulator